ncbi:MAG: hypothetical protein HQL72_07270 [Magnetococcales bacterium]|nr:hypothetical protein [Magnetococcales bacterium]
MRHLLSRRLGGRSLKESYWAFNEVWARVARLRGASSRDFRRLVIADQLQFIRGGVQPVRGESRQRAELAQSWLLTAQKATPDSGVSLGYFPHREEGSPWLPSYPETTGYIIQSLIDYSLQYDSIQSRIRALEMAQWESEVQMASGAVQGGPLCSPERQAPAVFNTGMVLQGYCSVLTIVSDERVLDAAHRAARFLVQDLGDDGHFRTHGPFVLAATIKTYNVLCAWALYRFGERSGNQAYIHAAIRSAEAAMGQQQENGWFAHNDLTNPEMPLTHTIGYTLQGILEVGVLAGREDMIAAVRLGLDPVLRQMKPSGFLAGRFFSDWRAASFSSCLTGSAQLAIVALRLFEITGEPSYRLAGDRLLNYLKGLQRTTDPDLNVNGALSGSFPLLLGSYMSGGFPNWASKYLLDGLMLQDRLTGTLSSS